MSEEELTLKAYQEQAANLAEQLDDLVDFLSIYLGDDAPYALAAVNAYMTLEHGDKWKAIR